jgi:hypothetical protein
MEGRRSEVARSSPSAANGRPRSLNFHRRKFEMSKAAENHRQVSMHYHDVARQHQQEAAHFAQAGNRERAAYHTAIAAEQLRQATYHADQAAKHA